MRSARRERREQAFLDTLAKKPSTQNQIIEATGISKRRFYFYRDNLKGQIYIKTWISEQPGWPTTPVYALGNEPDAPRPPVDTALNKRKWKANLKKRVAARDLAKEKQKRYRRKLKEQGLVPAYTPKPKAKPIPPTHEPIVQRDPWISALFGSTGVNR